MESQKRTEERSVKLLRAIRYAELARMMIAENCRYYSEASEEFGKACANLAKAPTEVLEGAALPFVQARVPEAEAKTVIEFFSSVEGRSISQKWISVGNDSALSLTNSENDILAQFKTTPSGVALQAFLEDPEVLPAVVKALSKYAP